MIQVYEATDVGRVRPVNEDSEAAFEPCVCVVADGMGGAAAGEVASQILIKSARERLYAKNSITETDLAEAIRTANAEILENARLYPERKGMGTTATILHVSEPQGRAYWAHVGDSRLYCLRDGALTQVTRDHSYVEDLVANGTITEEEARVHPQKNVLTRAVGVVPEVEVDTGAFPVKDGDIFLLATDGLMKMMEDGEIADMLGTHRGSGENLAQMLINHALDVGGVDNVTAIVVVYAS